MKNDTTAASYRNATGPIDYGMTNDYMFRTILQRNNTVLKGLISAVLRLEPEEIHSVVVTNPIEPGVSSDMKEFILDIHVMLNGNTVINLEMQVQNLHNWEDRSLSYLCRSFDQLTRGEDYTETKTVVHIGFLNFTPDRNPLEFFAIYKLQNMKNHAVYSDKFTLGVVDLTHIELATEEDREWQLDRWAELFTASTWEEIRMIAKNSEYLSSASQSLYELNTDDIERQKCRAREDYYRLQNMMVREQMFLRDENEKLTVENVKLGEKNGELEEKNGELEEKNGELEARNDKLTEENRELKAALLARESALVDEIEMLRRKLEQTGS